MTDILLKLRKYKFLTTKQIRNWCVPNDKDGSITRSVLRKMQALGLARRSQAEVNNPLTTANSPVWIPTEYGCSLLAIETNDATQLLDAIPSVHNWMQFAHFVAVSELVHTIEKAFERHPFAKLGKIILEHDVIECQSDPSSTLRLYTVLSRPLLANSAVSISVSLNEVRTIQNESIDASLQAIWEWTNILGNSFPMLKIGECCSFGPTCPCETPLGNW
jgi:hypothetical protein